MLTNNDIARAFLREGQSDLSAARVLFSASQFARCIAHAQHTVEKAIKSVLAARGTVITGRHQVSADFGSLCSDIPDATRITQIAARLERLGSRSEYPLFGDPNRPIWLPSESLTQQDAQEALDGAAFVFDSLSEYLADQHGVSL